GLVSSGVITLSEAILRSMALAPLKLAAGLMLAIAITATVARLEAPPENSVPAASAPGQAPVRHETAPRGEPGSGARADGPIIRPAMMVCLQIARAMPDGLFAASGSRWAQVVQDWLGQVVILGHAPAPARRARPLRDERARGEVLFLK